MASSVPKMLRALIIGPPGCGKGTISERIVKDFAMTHIASGDILRNHILKGTGDQKNLCVRPKKKIIVSGHNTTSFISK